MIIPQREGEGQKRINKKNMAVGKRENLVVLCAGKKGVGKTVATIEMIYKYVAGNPELGIPPRKALIFDVNDEFSGFWYHGETHSIKALAIKDVLKFSVHPKVEVRRIRPFFDSGKKMGIDDMKVVLGHILENYRNGLLLVEDINKYTSDTVGTDLVSALATVRHLGIDLIAHYQGVGRVANPKLLANTQIIRLHKTNDTVARHKNKFEERTEIMQVAESLVNNKFEEGNKRFYVYVNIDDSKIRGDFSEDDVDKAIESYLGNNYNTKVKPLANKVNMRTGKKMLTHEEAYTKASEDLKRSFFSK
jgi:hypothetical protein